MKLFRRSPSSWPPAWTFDAEAIIWRFLFDGAGRIIGEARDPERKQAWFFCIDEYTGAPVWNDLHLGEPWWVGIEAIDTGRLFLHGYRKPDMPQHLGITAVDVESGRQLWRNETASFLLAIDGEVYAAQETFGGMRYFRLSAEDGEVAEDLGEDTNHINTLRQRINEDDIFSGYRYPQPFGEDHPHYSALQPMVADLVDADTVTGNVDVYYESPLLCASWHEAADTPAGARLRQCLTVRDIDRNRTILHEIILDAADAPGMDSFFLKDDQLMFIKNRSVLTAHDVNRVPA